MLSIALNPGFVLLLGAVAVFAAPMSMRPATMAGASAAAMWLLLTPDFGAYDPFGQIGLTVVPYTLDALNQVFGIAFITATLLVSVYASERRSRYEDAAILLMAGGATSALFVGDLISFVAAAAVAGIGAAWVVLASDRPGAGDAGVRLLIWHGLEGLLFLAGVAFRLAHGPEGAAFERMSLDTLGGAFIFAALMIRVGAPLAHVWPKDVMGHASSVGAAALAALPVMLGVYALARAFPAEGLLAPIGVAMMCLGALFAAAEDDFRRAAAYGLTAQAGLCIAALGLGEPLALAAAAGHALTSVFGFTLLQMALGVVAHRRGEARASSFAGLARATPIAVVFCCLGGLAAAALPGLAGYASFAVALEAAGSWESRFIWLAANGATAVLFVALALRPLACALASPAKPPSLKDGPFVMLLGAGLAAFLCLSIGLSPAWLYRLTPPTAIAFDPYAIDRLAPHLAMLGAAGAGYLVLRALRAAPPERRVRLLDIDALYRGPLAGIGRWTGVVSLRIYGAWGAVFGAAAGWAGRAFAGFARGGDRPYSDAASGAIGFCAIGAVLVIILVNRL